MELLNRYRGCLLGGAAGDALGYAVEFERYGDIVARYGPAGITEYKLSQGQALVSDDTQMTLYTAAALLFGKSCRCRCGSMDPTFGVYFRAYYKDWARRQRGEAATKNGCWLMHIPELNAWRAPGNTCLSALRSSFCGTPDRAINDSKGCGGVMRVAPVGLYCGTMCLNADAKQSREFDGIAAMAAAVTHGHELGYIPAVGLARIVALAAHLPALDLDDIVVAARDDLAEFFSGKRHLPEMLQLIDQARELARRDDLSDVEAIGRLGEGWVAEETLAIAIYCALRYRDDFAKAIIAAVNHSGDSDSTGSVTGNILGAYLGERAIPQSFLEHLEGRDTIIEVAEELYRDIPSGWERILAGNLEGEDPEAVAWFNKYVDGQDCLEYYP